MSFIVTILVFENIWAHRHFAYRLPAGMQVTERKVKQSQVSGLHVHFADT